MHLGFFDKLANKVKARWKNITSRLKAYFKKLLLPLYLFPIKFVTYTLYYLIKFSFNLLFTIVGLLADCVRFPFKSLKNFLKAIVYSAVTVYLFFSFLVIGDYLLKQYGSFDKIWCG